MNLRSGFFQELHATLSTTILSPFSAICRFNLEQLQLLTGLLLRYLPEKWTLSIFFLLLGEMGSGKTTFVRALAEQLGIDTVCSPTFTLLHLHATERGTLFHFDLFRLQEKQDRMDSLEEFLLMPGLKCIEWPTDKILEYWKKETLILRLSVLDETTRSLQIDAEKMWTH